MSVIVRGATLSGMAAAARLARLGHDVTLGTDGQPLGTRWAPTPGPGGYLVDALPQVITLPATWRDLFKKSGSHLVTELNRAGLALVPAPPTEHIMLDDSRFQLPTERGAQYQAIAERYGEAEAARWRDLLDDIDDIWAAFRAHALEGTRPPTTKAERRRLGLGISIADLADRLHTELGCLVHDLADDSGGPALLALPLAIERTFGRWQLVDATGMPQRASRLIELLAERLVERGVRIVDDVPGGDIDCRPRQPHGSKAAWLRRGPAPAGEPTLRHELVPDQGVTGIREVVDHRMAMPHTTWLRRVPGGTLATTVDHTVTIPNLAWGLETRRAADWLRRIPIVDGDTIRASACSPAGAEPWAELASAALAAYEVHARLTGEDARPTNKTFRLPRLTARPVHRDTLERPEQDGR